MRDSFAWVALMTLLAGCDGGASAPAAPSAGTTAAPHTVNVAAASDLRFALDDAIARFERERPGLVIRPTYGSSGNFFAQLSNQAPFDLFLSADTEYPHKLVEAGKGLADSEFIYAIGRIVVWVPNNSRLDFESLGIRALLDPQVHRIAIANPRHAPYGRAAVAALKSLGIHEEIEPRLVLGDNVAQAAQFVESGAAEAGIFGMSLARSPALRAKGRAWEIPPGAYPRMEQSGVIVAGSDEVDSAREFRRFLLSDSGRVVLEEHGFLLPERD